MSTMFTGPGAFESVVYQDYVPQWTCASGGNPSLGNGTSIGRWARSSKFVHYYGEVDFGSSTTYGGGQWLISTPTTARSDVYILTPLLYAPRGGVGVSMQVLIFVSGANAFFSMLAGTTFGGVASAVTSTSPFTTTNAPTTGGYFAWDFVYESNVAV